jgi:NitT/TauT family transport system substrate-binding protein
MSFCRVVSLSFFLFLAGALGIFFSCAPLPAQADQQPSVGMSSRSFNPGFSNGWIGVPLGLFGPGVTPDVVGTQGAAENLQLMLSGKITMSTGTQDNILDAAAEGRILPVVIPCVYLRGILHRTSVLPSSSILSYADLKGKRVGVPTLSYGGVGFLKYALQASGVSPDDVQVIAVGDGQQAAVALTTGRVDALTNADVDVAQMQSLGIPLRVLPLPDDIKNASAGYAYVFNHSWYDAHKALALDLVKGYIRSVIFMNANPEAAVRISYYMHPEAIPSGISRAQAIANAVKIIEVREPLIQRTSPVSDNWCEFPPAAWRSLAGILGVSGPFDPAMFYTNEMISSVNKIDEPALAAWARSLKVPDNDADIPAWLKTLHPPLDDVK